VLTAMVWAVIHVQYQLHDLIPIFAFGCLLGAARVKTGSLAITIVMHSFANLVSFVETIIYLKWLTS
jgi:membrane protease YdiL (CAAX protease family)